MPNCIGITSQLYTKLNNNIPKDIDSISEIDIDSGYFKTLYRENFFIYDEKDIVLQSDIEPKILFENKKVFIEGTFFSEPKYIYIKF